MTTAAACLRDVTHAYEEDTPAIHHISFKIAAGAFACIIGQNGSGKTTLVKHLNGLLMPDAGTVQVLGADTREHTVAEMAKQVSFCFQNPDHQISQPTVREEIAFGPHNLGRRGSDLAEHTEHVMQMMELGSQADTPPSMLSLGLRKLVSIAGALAMEPAVLVLDEPSVGLDHGTLERVFGVIEGMRRKGCTVVCVTHDMDLVATHATQTIVMLDGSIIADGPPEQVLTDLNTLRRAHVTPPQTVRLAHDLHLSPHTLSVEDFCVEYARQVSS